jgi:hypothetical protein
MQLEVAKEGIYQQEIAHVNHTKSRCRGRGGRGGAVLFLNVEDADSNNLIT